MRRVVPGLLLWFLTACGDAPRYLVDEVAVTLPGARYQLVNYWAVWCKPCRAEVPELNALADQLAGSHPDVQLVGVNFDQPALALLREQRDALGIQFPVLLIAPESLGLPRPKGLPTTYLRAPDGRIVATLEGEQTRQSLWAALVAAGAVQENPSASPRG